MDAPAGLESYLREIAGAMANDPIDPAAIAEIASATTSTRPNSATPGSASTL
jgi:hypothetical protein